MSEAQAQPNAQPVNQNQDTATTTVVTDASQATPNGVTTSVNQHGSQESSDNNPAWLPARLERARENALKDFLASLGVSDAGQAKQALAEHRQLKEAQMTEQEKRVAELAQLQAELASAKQSKTEIEQAFESYKAQQLEQQLTERRKSAMETALKNTLNAKAVLLLIQDEYPDEYQAILKDDGSVDDSAVKALVEKASAAHGALFRVSTSPGSPSSSNRSFAAQSAVISPEEREKRRRNVFR